MRTRHAIGRFKVVAPPTHQQECPNEADISRNPVVLSVIAMSATAVSSKPAASQLGSMSGNPPRLLSELETGITVPEGDPVHLDVRVTSDSDVKITWLKDGKPLVSGKFKPSCMQTSLLELSFFSWISSIPLKVDCLSGGKDDALSIVFDKTRELLITFLWMNQS